MATQLAGEQFLEYEQNDYAKHSDDDKKIRSAESRAMRQKFRGRGRGTPYSRPMSTAVGSQAQLPTIGSGGTLFNQPFRSFAGSRTPNHPMYVTGVLRQATGRVDVPSTTHNHNLDF